MKKIIIFILFPCILLSLFGCNTKPSTPTYKTRSRDISTVYFNTYSMLSTYADESDEKIESYVEIAEETLSYYHKLFDIYYEYAGVNNIATINKNAGKNPVVVDEAMFVDSRTDSAAQSNYVPDAYGSPSFSSGDAPNFEEVKTDDDLPF